MSRSEQKNINHFIYFDIIIFWYLKTPHWTFLSEIIWSHFFCVVHNTISLHLILQLPPHPRQQQQKQRKERKNIKDNPGYAREPNTNECRPNHRSSIIRSEKCITTLPLRFRLVTK